MTLPKSFGVKLAGSRWGAGLQSKFARGFVYADARVDDARLVVLNALDAKGRGADIRVRTRVTGARREGGLWRATLQGSDGATMDVSARAIVNAAGPWVKHVLDSVSASPSKENVRHVKGSHIVVPRVHPEEHAYILQNADKRIVFIIPYQQHYSLIGTTDIPSTNTSIRRSPSDEIDYLLELVNSYLAKPLAASRRGVDVQRRAAAARRRVERPRSGDARLRVQGRRTGRRDGTRARAGAVDLRRQDHDLPQAGRGGACAPGALFSRA